jgi:hypothetical protein
MYGCYRSTYQILCCVLRLLRPSNHVTQETATCGLVSADIGIEQVRINGQTFTGLFCSHNSQHHPVELLQAMSHEASSNTWRWPLVGFRSAEGSDAIYTLRTCKSSGLSRLLASKDEELWI